MLKLGIFFWWIEHFWLVTQDSVNLWSQYVCVDTDYYQEHEDVQHKILEDSFIYDISEIFEGDNTMKYKLLRIPFTQGIDYSNSGFFTSINQLTSINKLNIWSLSWTLYLPWLCDWNRDLLKQLNQYYTFNSIMIPFPSDAKIKEIDINDKRYKNNIINNKKEMFDGRGNFKYLQILYKEKKYIAKLQYLDFWKLHVSKDDFMYMYNNSFHVFYWVDQYTIYGSGPTSAPSSLVISKFWKYLFYIQIYSYNKNSWNYANEYWVWYNYFQLMPIKIIIYKKNIIPSVFTKN